MTDQSQNSVIGFVGLSTSHMCCFRNKHHVYTSNPSSSWFCTRIIVSTIQKNRSLNAEVQICWYPQCLLNMLAANYVIEWPFNTNVCFCMVKIRFWLVQIPSFIFPFHSWYKPRINWQWQLDWNRPAVYFYSDIGLVQTMTFPWCLWLLCVLFDLAYGKSEMDLQCRTSTLSSCRVVRTCPTMPVALWVGGSGIPFQ